MTRPRIIDNQQGFTLIEIMIALTIFAFGLLGIAALQGRAIQFNAGSNTRTATTAIAQSAMEEILALDAGDPVFRADQAATVWDLDPNTAANSLTLPDGRVFNATWSILVDNPSPRISLVTVVVTGPNNRTVTLNDFKRYHL